MKNYFIFIILFSSFCFSQNDLELANKIDSIIKNNEFSRYGISEGLINSTKEIFSKKGKNTKINKGSGGFSISLFVNYTDDNYFNSLSTEEKKKYNRKFELIKGKYHQVIHYENSYTQNIYSDFYYDDKQLFYVKIKIIISKKGKVDKTEEFGYSIKELEESKVFKNEFLFDTKSWVREKNEEILKFYLKN